MDFLILLATFWISSVLSQVSKEFPPKPEQLQPSLAVDIFHFGKYYDFKFQGEASLLFAGQTFIKLTCAAPYPTRWETAPFFTQVVKLPTRQKLSHETFNYSSSIGYWLSKGSEYVACSGLDGSTKSELKIYRDARNERISNAVLSPRAVSARSSDYVRGEQCKPTGSQVIQHAQMRSPEFDCSKWTFMQTRGVEDKEEIHVTAFGLLYKGNLSSAMAKGEYFGIYGPESKVTFFYHATLEGRMKQSYLILYSYKDQSETLAGDCAWRYSCYRSSEWIENRYVLEPRNCLAYDATSKMSTKILTAEGRCGTGIYRRASYTLSGSTLHDFNMTSLIVVDEQNGRNLSWTNFVCRAVTFETNPQMLISIKDSNGDTVQASAQSGRIGDSARIATLSFEVLVTENMRTVSCNASLGFEHEIQLFAQIPITLPQSKTIDKDKKDATVSTTVADQLTAASETSLLSTAGDATTVPEYITVKIDPLATDLVNPGATTTGGKSAPAWVPTKEVELTTVKAITADAVPRTLTPHHSNFLETTAKMSTITIPVQQKNSTELGRRKEEGPTNPFLLLVLTVASIVALILLVAIIYYGRKYRKIMRKKRAMDFELKAFRCGREVQGRGSIGGGQCAQFIPFQKEISSEEILFESESGASSRINLLSIHKGTFREKEIVVKSTDAVTSLELFKAFLKDIKVMCYVGQNPNIVQFMGADTSLCEERIVHAVFEASSLGDIGTYLRSNSSAFVNLFGSHNALNVNSASFRRNKMVTTFTLLNWCDQLATAMLYLQQHKLIHGDLCLRNVILFPDDIVRVSDLCPWQKDFERSYYIHHFKPPPSWRWMAIELFRDKPFSPKTDIWALGVTIWEIFSLGENPHPGVKWCSRFVPDLENGHRMGRPQCGNEILYQMLLRCWYRYPNDRLDAHGLIQYLQDCRDSLRAAV